MKDPHLEALKAGLDNALEHLAPKGKCDHKYVFDILFSFENGVDEMEVCERCGDRRLADLETDFKTSVDDDPPF